jgi:hypothetical protein
VKFLITGLDAEKPEIYFMNTKTHQYHYYFARDVLSARLTPAQFNQMTYFTNQRKFLAGTIIAHDSFTLSNGTPGLYALEFWPPAPVSVTYTALAYNLARAGMPFANDTLSYHPSGSAQEDMFIDEADEYARRNISTVSSYEIFSHISYSPLNLGVGFGRLRILDGKSARPPSLTDIVILNTLPSDLPHVAGIISAEPSVGMVFMS